MTGPQFHRKERGGSVFHGAIADTEPDGWARRVIPRDHAKQRQQARQTRVEVESRPLNPLDFLLAVDDASGQLACAWLDFQLARKPAPSWLVVDRLKAAGHSGIVVPSFVPGAGDANRNLVLWRWGPARPHKVAVYDPSGRLPRDQLSWPSAASR